MPTAAPTTSRADLLAAVARTLPGRFTLEDLAVAAWRAHPRAFRMEGYDLPDKLAVAVLLYRVDGLLARGVLRERGERYEVAP